MIITVQQILDKKGGKILTIAPEDSVQDAIDIMAKKLVSALPVTQAGNVVGIISERDYIRKAAPKRQLPWEIKVKELMTHDVISVAKNESIHHCMTIMSSNRIRHLPVIENGDLVGIISITDVIRALRSLRLLVNEAVEAI